MNTAIRPDVVVLSGPTASGKSELAVRLAELCGGEIVNADSVQVYRGFSIGSGAPSAELTDRIPHHLFSSIDPDADFNAGIFRSRALELVSEITSRNAIPFIVGGTGLYIRALLCGLLEHDPIDEEVLEHIAERESYFRDVFGEGDSLQQRMHSWLARVDPQGASRISTNDLQRIRRALAVAIGLGVPISELQERHRNSSSELRALVVAILPEREGLYRAIDRRVDSMIEMGLIAEVEHLRRHYDPLCRGFSAIGYRHVCGFLDGVWDFQEMLRLFKRDTRRFAKRQLTWWRNQPETLGWQPFQMSELTGNLIREEKRGLENEEVSEVLAVSIKRFLGEEGRFSTENVAFLPLPI